MLFLAMEFAALCFVQNNRSKKGQGPILSPSIGIVLIASSKICS